MAISFKVEENKNGSKTLVIRADLDPEGKASASGKSVVLASTHGNVPVGDTLPGVSVGLNVYRRV